MSEDNEVQKSVLAIHDLLLRIEEIQQTLSAIRGGEVDALILRTGRDEQVYTLAGADHIYHSFVETMNEGALTIQEDGTIISCNNRFAEFLKTPPEQVSGSSVRHYVVAEDLLTFDTLLEQGLRGHSNAEIGLRARDGDRVKALFSINSIPMDQMKGVCTAIVMDVTALRLAQEALGETHATLAAKIQEVQERTQQLTQANQTLKREIDGRKQAEIALQKAHDELEVRVQERTAELMETNRRLQKEIAERRRVEQSLRDSEERFRQLVEHLDDIFWMSNADGSQLLYVSPAYEKVRGYSCQHVYEHPSDWLEAIHPEDRTAVRDVHARMATGEFSEEYRIIRSDGTIRWIWSRGFPIRNAAGRIYRIAGIAQDITQRKQTEQKLRQQQAELTHIARLSLAGEMAAGLAHELNQPLAAIVTYAHTCLQMLHSEKTSPDLLTELLKKVVSQGLRAGEIIRRLKAFVRKAESEKHPVHPNDLIQDVVRLVQFELSQQDVKLQLKLANPLPLVWADSIQIQQVLLNLIRNSLDVMVDTPPEERVLTIRIRAVGETSEAAEAVEIIVSDSGPGVSPKAMAKLFQPFFTTKHTGMGLGLSISKTIIEAHQGDLWATPDPERGVSFHFTLPIWKRDL